MKTANQLILIIIIILYNNISWADGYLNGQIKFFDTRVNTDNNSYLATSLRNTNKAVKELLIYIYDRDGSCIDFEDTCNENDDDLLTQGYTNTSGNYNLYVSTSSEDIYLMTEYENVYGTMFNPDYTQRQINSGIIQENFSGTKTKNWNITCNYSSNGECSLLLISNSYYSQYYQENEPFADILASLYDMASFMDDEGVLNINNLTFNNGEEFHIHYPNDVEDHCDGMTDGGKSWDWGSICIAENTFDENHIVAHEGGHNLQRRALYTTNLNGGCPSPHGWNVNAGNDKCPIVEGWAEFVAAAVYWPAEAEDAWLRNATRTLEGNTTNGNSSSMSCVSQNSNPDNVDGNVARWFWDLYDSVNVDETSTEDGENQTFNYITTIWDSFPPGTANRQNNENGADGRNAYDYKYYYTNSSTELTKNCLSSQAQ